MEVMEDISNPWFPRMEFSPQYECFVQKYVLQN